MRPTLANQIQMQPLIRHKLSQSSTSITPSIFNFTRSTSSHLNSIKCLSRSTRLDQLHRLPTSTNLISRQFSSTPSTRASYRRFGNDPQSSVNTLTKVLPPSLRGSPIILILIGIGGGYYIVHLEKESHTGRWRFLDVTRNQELNIGQETYQQTLNEYRGRILSRSDGRTQMVEKVCSRLIAAIDPKDLDPNQKTDWKVFVVKDDQQKNAFVVPGGKIFVFTGILGVCKDEDGLATVLGHEIAHQLARHSAEKMSGLKIIIAASFLLQLIGLDPGLSSMAGNLLLSLPNSRKVEMEADFIGLGLMSRACYNPQEATHLWERMEASEGSSSSFGDTVKSVLSTHPVNRKRIENIKKWLPSALETRSDAGCRPNEMKAFSTFGNRLGI